METPIPEKPSHEKFIYYYLITGSYWKSLLFAGYNKKGLPIKRSKPYTKRKMWGRPNFQRKLKEITSEMAKNKLRVKKPALPEAEIDTMEGLIATAEEVLVYLTACMRGEITEETLMPRLCGAGEQIIERLRKEITPKDRTRAAELLAKRYGLLSDKVNLTVQEPVVFSGEDDLED